MWFSLRAAVLLITTWFTLDVSTPFIPGAFQFSADESVEVVSTPDQSIIIPIHHHAVAPGFDVSWSIREDTSIRPRASVLPRVRLVPHDGPRRQDHDLASSARLSDPA